MNYYYSPHTGEQILTDDPADWMGRTAIAPPPHDATQSAVFAGGAWAVVDTLPPVVQIPKVVSMRQARLALLGAGLLANVNAAIAGMAAPSGDAARIEWEFAAEVQRTSPLIAQLAAGLRLTDADLDALFKTAVTL